MPTGSERRTGEDFRTTVSAASTVRRSGIHGVYRCGRGGFYGRDRAIKTRGMPARSGSIATTSRPG